jgi:hypothetical protein
MLSISRAEAERSSEALTFYLQVHTALQPRDQHRYLHRRENLKSSTVLEEASDVSEVTRDSIISG